MRHDPSTDVDSAHAGRIGVHCAGRFGSNSTGSMRPHQHLSGKKRRLAAFYGDCRVGRVLWVEVCNRKQFEMDIGTAAMLTLAAAAPALASSVQHDIIGPLYYEETMLKLPIQYDSGCALAPLENSGLGIQLKETAEALTQESI